MTKPNIMKQIGGFHLPFVASALKFFQHQRGNSEGDTIEEYELLSGKMFSYVKYGMWSHISEIDIFMQWTSMNGCHVVPKVVLQHFINLLAINNVVEMHHAEKQVR